MNCIPSFRNQIMLESETCDLRWQLFVPLSYLAEVGLVGRNLIGDLEILSYR